MDNRHDLRRQDRHSCFHTISVVWRDARGEDKFANAQVLDVSESGLRMKLPEAVPYQSSVTLRATKLGIHGQASVRHCSRVGTRYTVGVQFAGNLRWNSPALQ